MIYNLVGSLASWRPVLALVVVGVSQMQSPAVRKRKRLLAVLHVGIKDINTEAD